MGGFVTHVAKLTGADPASIRPLAGGDLSDVLLVEQEGSELLVAKSGPAVETEAAMLRAIRTAGVPAPEVVAVKGGILLLGHVPNDGRWCASAWRDLGEKLRQLHAVTGESYGWDADYAFGSVRLVNRRTESWRRYWAEQRLVETASGLDTQWHGRIDALAARIGDILPENPLPSLLHGDLWSGNILVGEGRLAALIDPACYHGHNEVDLAMLTLFGSPGDEFREAYGALDQGWEERRTVYQLFPALVHLRLFGSSYAGMVDGLLSHLGF
jgi:fructosamine-3-kinase